MTKEKKEEYICEVCGLPYEHSLQVIYEKGKKYCKHDSDVVRDKLAIQRKANINATAEAMMLAARMKSEVPPEKMVTVESHQEGSVGKVATVPEKVLKSLDEKIAPVLKELEQ